MPRIHQYAEKYAIADFQQDIRRQQGHYDLMSVRALAGAVGIPHTTLNPKLKDPKKLTVEDLQKIIPVIHPDIETLLVLLGCSRQEINKFRRQCNEEKQPQTAE